MGRPDPGIEIINWRLNLRLLTGEEILWHGVTKMVER